MSLKPGASTLLFPTPHPPSKAPSKSSLTPKLTLCMYRSVRLPLPLPQHTSATSARPQNISEAFQIHPSMKPCEIQLLALSSPNLLSTLLLAELYQGSSFPTVMGQHLTVSGSYTLVTPGHNRVQDLPPLFWLNNVPLCIYDTFSLSTHPLMVVSRSYMGFPQQKGKQGFNVGVGG